MKRNTFKVLAITFLMGLSFSSCELLDCKTCTPVSTTNGVTTRGVGVLTCGDELAEKENAYESYGNTTTYYVCE